MTKNTAERIEVLNVISARRRPKNNEEFWPAWAGGSAEMAPPCIPPGPIYIRLCNGLKLCLGFQQVNLGSHLHQDCAKSMSENHFKVGKFGVSLAYYYDHSFTFRFYRINCWRLNATLNSGQHRESVVTVLPVVFVNVSLNKIHLLDFQTQEIRIVYLCRGSNRPPSISFPRCLLWWSGTTKAWHVGHGCLNSISLLSTALQSKYHVLHRFT